MRIISCLAAAAVMLAGAAPAAAERWYRVARDSRAAAYVDADSIHQEGEFKRAIVYTFLAAPYEGLHAAAILTEYHCGENFFRNIEHRFFGADQALLSTEQSPDRRQQPERGSFDARFFAFVCRGTGGTLVGASAWSDGQAWFQQRGRRGD